MMPGAGYFHLHLVSDSTGETLITVARAAAAQYTKVIPVEHVHPLVRTPKQLDRVLVEIEEMPGIVLYTLLQGNLVDRLEQKCRDLGLPCLSVLGPVLHLFQSYLGAESTHKVGAQHTLNAEYFRRIDALNYTMMHDDGQQADDLEEADVLLIGVSRTSKTPTSIYLANRGVKTANVPLVFRRAVAARPRTAPASAGRRLIRYARAYRANSEEPAAGTEGVSRRRQVYRSAIGGGGSRRLAPALRET